MKQVWVNCATCACTRSATRGAALPTEVTAMPEPKSMSELPSASTSTPPPAAVMKTGSMLLTPRATALSRRAISWREAGPGISVTRRRCWGSPGPPCGAENVVIPPTLQCIQLRLSTPASLCLSRLAWVAPGRLSTCQSAGPAGALLDRSAIAGKTGHPMFMVLRARTMRWLGGR